jgi:hypothetical protein
MAVFLLCSWFESLAVALHPLQPVRFSVSRVWFLIHPSSFSLSQILHLPRTSFAAVIRPLFNQFLGGHSVK